MRRSSASESCTGGIRMERRSGGSGLERRGFHQDGSTVRTGTAGLEENRRAERTITEFAICSISTRRFSINCRQSGRARYVLQKTGTAERLLVTRLQVWSESRRLHATERFASRPSPSGMRCSRFGTSDSGRRLHSKRIGGADGGRTRGLRDAIAALCPAELLPHDEPTITLLARSCQ